MNMPQVPWELLIKTASLAQMNAIDEAKLSADKLQQQFPFLQHILKPYMGAFLQDQQLIDKLYDGLIKAGAFSSS